MNLIDKLDTVLPQTQCGLCGYGGCRPYAEAIAHNNEQINLCPPGGVETLQKLADLTSQDASSYLDEMKQKAKPPLRAVIREDECIGCTKCIQACPVDAIIGSSKLMHTVIQSECTGCELCVPPCPVNCIDIIEVPEKHNPTLARQRYQAKQLRLKQNTEQAIKQKPPPLDTRKAFIQAAVSRAKAKKHEPKETHRNI